MNFHIDNLQAGESGVVVARKGDIRYFLALEGRDMALRATRGGARAKNIVSGVVFAPLYVIVLLVQY